MSEFQFKEIDEEGMDTLDAISSADKFNQWMYDTIAPRCTGKILEIGSGIGNISNFFLKNGANITLSDIRDNYCDALRNNFKEYNAEVINVNIADEDFDKKYAHLLNSFDTIFSLNVVEHIKDHSLAVKNCKKLLRDSGTLVTLVPAYQSIYNGFDTVLEHYRRYTKKSLTELLEKEYTVTHKQYFNFIGIFGWVFTGGILRKKTIPSGQMGLYNKLVPIFKVIDKIMFNSMGLSVIAVAKKK